MFFLIGGGLLASLYLKCEKKQEWQEKMWRLVGQSLPKGSKKAKMVRENEPQRKSIST